jgi:hypothetical protein
VWLLYKGGDDGDKEVEREGEGNKKRNMRMGHKLKK